MVSTEGWSRYAREQIEFLRSARKKGANDREMFVSFISYTIVFVDVLAEQWQQEVGDLRRGGMAARYVISRCDDFLSMIEAHRKHLIEAEQGFHSVGLPVDIANQIQSQMSAALIRIEPLVQEIGKIRAWAAAPPRISAEPEDIKKRIKQADEENDWLKLAKDTHAMPRGNIAPGEG